MVDARQTMLLRHLELIISCWSFFFSSLGIVKINCSVMDTSLGSSSWIPIFGELAHVSYTCCQSTLMSQAEHKYSPFTSHPGWGRCHDSNDLQWILLGRVDRPQNEDLLFLVLIGNAITWWCLAKMCKKTTTWGQESKRKESKEGRSTTNQTILLFPSLWLSCSSSGKIRHQSKETCEGLLLGEDAAGKERKRRKLDLKLE